MESLLEIQKQSVDQVVGSLLDKSENASKEAGQRLVKTAAEFGLNARDYLNLAVQGDGEASGYEQALAYLNLPVRNDFDQGIVLQAASNTFQTHPGTRALFPEVIDDMLRWSSRQPRFETVAPMLANSRNINGVEMLSTTIDEQSGDPDPFATRTVPEGARIPVRSVRTSESSVKIWKHGSALRTTYEFNRRASIDLLTPHANRIARELEASKVTAAVNILINGDGVHGAASETDQSSYDSNTGTTSTNGRINWQNFLYWLVQRAKAGTPVDTVVGNWDAAFEWARLWAVNGSDTVSDRDNFEQVAGQMTFGGGFQVAIPQFAVSSAMPANKLLGLVRGETLEELIEAGSNIQESERSILNQTITFVKTENTGYKLVYGDTRELYDYGN